MSAVPIDRPLRTARAQSTGDRSLFERWHQNHDRAARDELVGRHLTLARKLAGRYAHTQEPFEDLFQVACLGLIKSVERFDPDRGVAFSSYAVPTILGELKRHFRDKGYTVHFPRGLQELVLKVQEVEAEVSCTLGDSPSAVQVARHLSIDLERVLEALEAIVAQKAVSIDEPIDTDQGGHSISRHETVGSCDDGYGLVEMSWSVDAAAERLAPRERQVLRLRLDHQLKQREIAERVGVSQMQVSRILRSATAQLRDNLDLSDDTPAD
jgi:RNA polymerase sigma-B factor